MAEVDAYDDRVRHPRSFHHKSAWIVMKDVGCCTKDFCAGGVGVSDRNEGNPAARLTKIRQPQRQQSLMVCDNVSRDLSLGRVAAAHPIRPGSMSRNSTWSQKCDAGSSPLKVGFWQ
jgi:hypothetical protein